MFSLVAFVLYICFGPPIAYGIVRAIVFRRKKTRPRLQRGQANMEINYPHYGAKRRKCQ